MITVSPDTENSSAAYLDSRAWRVICDWHKYVRFNPVKNRVDFAKLIRFFLWDKVGRAIRKQGCPEQFSLEEELYTQRKQPFPPHINPSRPGLLCTPFRTLRALTRTIVRSQKIIYVPYPSKTIASIIHRLIADQRFCVVVPSYEMANYPGAVEEPANEYIKAPDYHFGENLVIAVQQGLSKQDVMLLDADVEVLKSQVFDLLFSLEKISSKIASLRPDALLVHTDNHPPYLSAVLTAEKMRIKTLTLQHGLDTEHHYYDDAYASVIAAWGESRAKRYQKDSIFKPSRICVTGNPEFDGCRKSDAYLKRDGYWLWLTRPHVPEKCYAPSRSPMEGLQILEAICKSLNRSGIQRKLVIKPHPADYECLYRKYIMDNSWSEQVSLADGCLTDLLPGASIVISEDSTAGMEAMIHGKPLIHSHFSKASPVLPFVEYGVALPGFTPEQLEESLVMAEDYSSDDLAKLSIAQDHFLSDYAGPLDGQSTARVFSLFVEEILK